MKKFQSFVLTLAAAVMTVSCSDLFRDELTALHNEIDELKAKVSQINTTISSLGSIVREIQDGGYVKAISPVLEGMTEIGYTLLFSDNTSLTIYNGKDGRDGSEGSTPVVGVKQTHDGIWCWTVDGEFITDSSGFPVRATGNDGRDGQDGENGQDGISPVLKIEDDYWFLSMDKGKTWEKLGKSTGEDGKDGQDGDSMFKDIREDETSVTLVLNDTRGTEIVIPKGRIIGVSFDCGDGPVPIAPKETVSIRYTLNSGSGKSRVTASSDGNFILSVTPSDEVSGVIDVTCPLLFTGGYINVMVNDGSGYTSLDVITFCPRKLEFISGTQFSIGTSGGVIEVPFTSNYGFSVSREDMDWAGVEVVSSDGGLSGKMLLTVSPNPGGFRTGQVLVRPSFGSETLMAAVTVNQDSAYYTIDYSNFVSESKGGTFVSRIKTSRGVDVRVPSGVRWVACDMMKDGADGYAVTFTVDANSSTAIRDVEIPIYSTDASSDCIGRIKIEQLASDYDRTKDLVFDVKANFANGFSVYLPLSGNVDCYVDWGDGSVDHIIEADAGSCEICHKYAVSSSTSFEVRIAGTVSALSSKKIPSDKRYAIIGVKQWGHTGLKVMEGAFDGIVSLEYLAEDQSGSFADVEVFDRAFAGCSMLSSIPGNLFVHASRARKMRNLFSGCTSVAMLPSNLFKSQTLVEDFSNAFANTGIIDIPAAMFEGCAKTVSFYGVFSDCVSLETVPSDLFGNCTGAVDFAFAFSGCSSLPAVPSALFQGCPMVTTFERTFQRCALTEIPSGLFRNNTEVNTFAFVFYSCQNVRVISPDIFDSCVKVSDFSGALFGIDADCESPYTMIDGKKVHLYERRDYPDYFVAPESFNGCFKNRTFSDYSDIPSDWKK